MTRSIRGIWLLMTMVFVGVLVGLGAFVLTLGERQQALVDESISHAEASAAALAIIDDELLQAEADFAMVIYEIGTPPELEERWQQFEQHSLRIHEQFEVLHRIGHVDDGPGGAEQEDAIKTAEAAWRRVEAGVAAARAAWGTGEIAAGLSAGGDTFGDPVWAADSEARRALAQASLEWVDHLRAEGDAARRDFEALEPVLATVVGAAVALGVVASWFSSRRVVRPMQAVGAHADAIRGGALADTLEVPRAAVREITEVATSLNQMARAVRRSQATLLDQVRTDSLTGLGNRRALGELLDQAFTRAADGSIALLVIDLDDFKLVNDSMGHPAGDRLLAAVASRLRTVVRDGDMVARLGGDEFAIVVTGEGALTSGEVLAARVVDVLGDTFDLDGVPVRVACSIGLAANGPDARDAEELLRNADVAMYWSKRHGPAVMSTFDTDMRDAMVNRGQLQQDLGRAVELEQLELHYQPIVDLGSEELLGFEALVRWNHPVRGMVSPLEFIALAQDTGEIVAIGDWVIDRACQDLALFRAAAPELDDLFMSVNVSGKQIAHGGLVAAVRGALRRHDVEASALVLEVTEQAVLTDIERAAGVLQELRRLDVRVAIDDFGTGYSSLRYLSELPLDILKIDRCFVSEQSADDGKVVLEAIVDLGRRLGLHLVAEGIERSSERDRLRRLGSMAGQGYLFAAPMPATSALEVVFEALARRVPAGPCARHAASA